MQKKFDFSEKSCVFLRNFAGLFRLFTVLYRYKNKARATAQRSKKMATIITKATEKKLLQIAKQYSVSVEERGDLKVRNSDSEDFIDISVWSLEQMLQRAYALGREDK